MRNNNRNWRRPKEPDLSEQYRVNDQINVPKVRLVGDNVDNDIYRIQDAIDLAQDLNLDLVELSGKSDPPVCKIMDFSKFIYEQKKKQKRVRANSAKVVIKELRYGPQTDEHDYQFKKKHAISFLKSGAKVRAYVFFKGRSIAYKEFGEKLLRRLIEDLEEYAKLDQDIQMERKKMIIVLAPK